MRLESWKLTAADPGATQALPERDADVVREGEMFWVDGCASGSSPEAQRLTAVFRPPVTGARHAGTVPCANERARIKQSGAVPPAPCPRSGWELV